MTGLRLRFQTQGSRKRLNRSQANGSSRSCLATASKAFAKGKRVRSEVFGRSSALAAEEEAELADGAG